MVILQVADSKMKPVDIQGDNLLEAQSPFGGNKFCQNTYFKSSRVPMTGFAAPVSLEEGLRRTIDCEFVKKVQGHTFSCE